jgi:hypothetical protein
MHGDTPMIEGVPNTRRRIEAEERKPIRPPAELQDAGNDPVGVVAGIYRGWINIPKRG